MKQETPLHQLLAVTAEVCGTQMSEAAAEIMATELAAYPRHWIVGALKRCRQELKSRLTMAAVLERIADGRPGPDEAFAMLPNHEAESVVWTDEMARASKYKDTALDSMTQRRAFAEAYVRAVQDARANGVAPRWHASLGHDPGGREAALLEAVSMGRLTHSEASYYLPLPDRTDAAGVARIAQIVGSIGRKAA